MLKKDIKLLTKRCRQILFSTLILSSPFAMANDVSSVERLSLFVSDGSNIYENRQLTKDTLNTLPNGISVKFESKKGANNEDVWQWHLKNTTKNSFSNLRVTGLIDVDINAPVNTFFNEYGSLISLTAPQGYIPSDRWEVSEPGYLKGDLITRSGRGFLNNSSDLPNNSSVDDPAIALSTNIGNLRAGEELIVVATLDADGTEGVKQEDQLNPEKAFFNFYAKKGFFGRSSPFANQGGLLTTGALVKDGNVWVWGFRGSSQQGNGTRVVASNAKPAKVESLQNVKSFAGGAYHLIALDETGNVYGWGQSGYGETGCDPTEAIYVSTPCKVLENATQIAAGEYFSVALDSNGQVWTWGHNLYGQLGDGGRQNSRTPIAVNLNGETARLIGGAYEGAWAVTNEGHVYAWGDNEAWGLGIPGTIYGVQQIIRTPTRVPNLEQYADQMVYIAGGNGWGEALLDDGRVIGWGLTASLGQSTFRTDLLTKEPIVIMDNVEQLYARFVGSIALTKETTDAEGRTVKGRIYTWGQTGGSAFPEIYGPAPSLRNTYNDTILSIGGGKEHVFYETENGDMFGVGYNDLYKIDLNNCCGIINTWPGKGFTID